jgi:hypothetical protein
MPWGVAAAAVAAAGSIYASNKAAGAQKKAANSSIAEQQREYDQTREDQLPFLQAGQNAVNLQQQYLSGDTSGFENSPDYKFAVSQGFKGLDAGAASRGNLWGGGTDADRISLGQGLATQYANNYWNKLAGMAGQGQSSATNLGAVGQNTAGNIGSYLNNAGAATASSYIGNANTIGNFANQAANWYGQNYGSGSSSIPATGYQDTYYGNIPKISF